MIIDLIKAMIKETAYNDIKDSLAKVRRLMYEDADYSKPMGEPTNNDGVPYSQQDEFYASTVDAAKAQLGADFSDNKNPMIYYPEDNDVVLSGKIPSLNNAKFQMRLRENNGCLVWLNQMMLSDDVISRLSKLLGFYKNWKQELEMTDDIKPISLHNEEQQ